MYIFNLNEEKGSNIHKTLPIVLTNKKNLHYVQLKKEVLV